MNTPAAELFTPSVLVVDDEAPILSSLRLRLGKSCKVTGVTRTEEALELVRQHRLDLCIVDVHMPGMDGLTLIEEARKIDPALGFVIFSGYDSEENLRRAIPLNVYDFITKPLPDREHLERRVPSWIDRTRAKRREMELSQNSAGILQDLEIARIEKDVEATASESARAALLSTAGMLTTAQALLLNITNGLESAARADAKLGPLVRNLIEARKQVESASAVTENYFASAYADRDSSPAVIDSCARHAIEIGLRLGKAEERRQNIDFRPLDRDIAISGLTGIDFLLLLVPAILQGLEIAAPNTTLRLHCDAVPRIDSVFRQPGRQDLLWVNRRNAALSSPGVAIHLQLNGPAPEESPATAWLRGEQVPALKVPSRGLVRGIQKAKGVLGLATKPAAERFSLLFVVPF